MKMPADSLALPFVLGATASSTVINCEVNENKSELFMRFSDRFSLFDEAHCLEALKCVLRRLARVVGGGGFFGTRLTRALLSRVRLVLLAACVGVCHPLAPRSALLTYPFLFSVSSQFHFVTCDKLPKYLDADTIDLLDLASRH